MNKRTINFRLLGLLLLATLLTGGLAHVVHQFQLKRNAGVLLREAESAKARKDFSAAIDFFGRYVWLVPNDNLGPLSEMALLQADLGWRPQAYMNLEKVLRLDAGREDIRRRLVETAVAMGRYVDAQQHLEILFEKAPDDVDLLELSAECQIAMGNYAAASESLSRIIEIDPMRLEAYSWLARLRHDRMKNAAGALSLLDEMVDKNASNYLAFVVRGTFRLDHPTLRQAAIIIDDVPDGDEPMPDPVSLTGLEAATADARRVLELAPDVEAAIEFSVRCLVAADHLGEAAVAAQRGLTLFPKNGSLYVLLASIESRADRRAEAISWLERGLAATSDEPDLLWNLSNLLIDDGRLDDAEKSIERLRSLKYPKVPLDYLEARMLAKREQWFAASQMLERLRPALTQWPDLLKQADFVLGQCYESLGRTDLQLSAFRLAAGSDSQWVPARTALADALLATGRIDEALAEYQQIVSLPSVPTSALVQLARVLLMVNLRRNAFERDWDAVTTLLDRIERIDADAVAVPIQRAEVLLAEGEDAKAAELLQAALDRSPKTIEFWLGMAALGERRGDWEQAWKILDNAQAALGDSVKIRLARARHLVKRHQGDARDSLRKLAEEVESFTPDDQMSLYSGMAALAIAIGDFDQTERLCRVVAKRQPFNLRVRLLLFDLAYRAGKPSLMAQVLDEVQRIERAGPLWHYGEAVRLTVVAKQNHQPELYSKAKSHLSEARIARPTWSRIPLLLAQIHDAQGDEESAISDYKEAINQGELDPGTISHTVALLYQRRRFTEADRLIRRLQEQQSPFSTDINRLAAEVSLRLNDTERALALVTKAAKTSTDPNEHVWAGRILSILGRNDEAEASFHQAIKLDETLADAWVGLIQHFGRTSQIPKAEAALKEARQNIKPAEAPAALGQALESLGRRDEAEADYKRAMELAPDEPPVVRRLADFYLRQGNVQSAEPLLAGLLNRSKGASDDDRMWCRRNLALTLATTSRDSSVTKKALALVDENLALEPASESDQRVRAMVLALSADRAARIEAAGILEKLVGDKKSLEAEGISESRFVLAQLYTTLKELPKAAGHLRTLLASHGDNPRYVAYYVQFLLARNEINEAEIWLPQLLKLAPQDFSTWKLVTEVEFRLEHYEDLLYTIDRFISNRAVSETERQLVIARSAELLELFAKRIEKTTGSRDSQEASRTWAARLMKRADQLYRQDVQNRPQDILALAAFLGRREQHADSLDILEKEWATARPEQIAAVTVTLLTSTAATQDHLVRAEKLLRAALDQHQRPVTLLLALADLQNMRERYDEAETLYREILAKAPRNIGALNNLAQLLALRKRAGRESIELVEKAIQAVGPDPALLDTRATIKLVLGDPHSALPDLEQSLAGQLSAVALFHQSLAEQKLGKQEAANESLKKANDQGLRVVDLHPLERPVYRQLQKDLQ